VQLTTSRILLIAAVLIAAVVVVAFLAQLLFGWVGARDAAIGAPRDRVGRISFEYEGRATQLDLLAIDTRIRFSRVRSRLRTTGAVRACRAARAAMR
jgi:hypothetical protein